MPKLVIAGDKGRHRLVGAVEVALLPGERMKRSVSPLPEEKRHRHQAGVVFAGLLEAKEGTKKAVAQLLLLCRGTRGTPKSLSLVVFEVPAFTFAKLLECKEWGHRYHSPPDPCPGPIPGLYVSTH
jgi:hypothetical protein